MTNHASSSAPRLPEDNANARSLAELVIQDRAKSLETLESYRAQARSTGSSALEDLLLQAQQADQRLLESTEKFISGLSADGETDAPHRDRLVDEEVSESFPASDPPTYSRIT